MTRASQLASVSVVAKDICSFIADQRAEDLYQYVNCLELVSRGLVSGKVQLMVECLRRLMEDEDAITPVNGNVIFKIICLQ